MKECVDGSMDGSGGIQYTGVSNPLESIESVLSSVYNEILYITQYTRINRISIIICVQ